MLDIAIENETGNGNKNLKLNALLTRYCINIRVYECTFYIPIESQKPRFISIILHLIKGDLISSYIVIYYFYCKRLRL